MIELILVAMAALLGSVIAYGCGGPCPDKACVTWKDWLDAGELAEGVDR